MKWFFLYVLFLVPIGANASDSSLVFTQMAYEEILKRAQTENKPVMLYFHFDGCGACKRMEKSAFKDNRVSEFYNSKFINFEINTLKEEGRKINKIYNVNKHPTFLFLNSEGKEVHRVVGLVSPEIFVSHAKNALTKDKTLSYFKWQYEEGNRDPDFLYEFCYSLSDAFEFDSLATVEYIKSQSEKELSLERNIKFIYDFALYNYTYTMPFESREFKFLLNNKEAFYKHCNPEQVDSRVVFITSEANYKAIENLDEERFKLTVDVLRNYKKNEYRFIEMRGRFSGIITDIIDLALEAEMEYHLKSGDKPKYDAARDLYIEKSWDNWKCLNNISWEYYETVDDKQELQKAKKWIIRSIELFSTYANNDTYLALLNKLEEYNNALIQAEKTLEIAKNDGVDLNATLDVIDNIKKKLEE